MDGGFVGRPVISDSSTLGLELMIPVIQYNNEGSENSQELHVRHFVFTLSKPVGGF